MRDRQAIAAEKSAAFRLEVAGLGERYDDLNVQIDVTDESGALVPTLSYREAVSQSDTDG